MAAVTSESPLSEPMHSPARSEQGADSQSSYEFLNFAVGKLVTEENQIGRFIGLHVDFRLARVL
ncbi:MAG: hypothetical protein Q9213_004542 [Squamulea squamosa]